MMSLLGTQYVNNGRSVTADGGLDCWGLVCEVYRKSLSVNLPSFLISDGALRRIEFDRQAESNWRQLSSPTPFAVVLYRLPDGLYHCGVVLPDCRRFMHCRAPCVAIEALDAIPWRRLLKGYYEYGQR